MQPLVLPIYRHKDRIIEALSQHQVIVVESPTGSGKTTQIPQILLEAGYGRDRMIGVTQPRRIAAVSVCEFIARQLKKTIPDTVGYKMRFEDQTDPRTRIKIMTDGILLQEIKGDPLLSRYNVLMVDEAHERSLNIDFSLGLLKRVLKARNEFKVIVSSATINAEIFSEYFDECPIVRIDSPTYPIQLYYTPPQRANNLEAMFDKILEIVSRRIKKQGDILIFLAGEGVIKNCMVLLQNRAESKKIKVLPLYSRLSADEQGKIFGDYHGKTKVIVATNIAETSLTIDGITCVIDSGSAKMNFYNARNYTSSLVEVPVSRASANQRKGRAGRTQPGECFRLYSKADYETRALFTQEEILRTDLSEVVLRMAELDIYDFEHFDFLSPPGKEGIRSAVETLQLLDALDENRELTAIGRQMLPFPTLPRISRIIVEAILKYPQVLEEILISASFLSSRSPFILPPGEELEARKAHHRYRDPQGDFLAYLKIFRQFSESSRKEEFCRRSYLDQKTMLEITNIKEQLEEIVSAMGIPISSGGSTEDYLCAVARGLIQFVCVRSEKGAYRTLTAGRIEIHPGSGMYRENPAYIVAGEIVKTSRIFARSVSPLRREWLNRISPILARTIGTGKHLGAKEIPRKRDFSNSIKIGGEVFKIVQGPGKRKTVILPLPKIKKLMVGKGWKYLPNFKNLRGKLTYKGWELLGGMRLTTILRLVPRLDPDRGILEVPESRFSLPEDFSLLNERIDDLLRICRIKKEGKKLGFVALQTDGAGSFWLKGMRNFSSALAESLSSLEMLADAPAHRHSNRINRVYRKLSQALEGL